MRKRCLPILLLIALGGTACVKQGSGVDPHALDGVKLISPSITDEYAAESMNQEKYEIGENRRLLLRFEQLKDHVSNILTDEGHPVELEVTLSRAEDAELARTELKLYPLTKSWMMRATWDYAHPFFWPQGVWGHPGGDYRSDEEIAVGTVTGSKLRFNVTSWFQSYPLQGMNYGLVLTSGSSLELYGDGAQEGSPRLFWTERAGLEVH
jgi:hypothetical protein